MAKSQASTSLNKRSGLLELLSICAILCLSIGFQVAMGDKGGDDIILSKGKIIMRGGKGKGNIILDPGSHNEESHSMGPMMSLMSHYNPYAFYPMQSQHQPQHQQPSMMIHPIYMEDHSAMQQHHQHQPEEHHEQHHEQHQYHHEEPQQHYEHQDMGSHHQEHYEPQHHEAMQHQQYEQEGSEHDQGGQEEQQHHQGAYEHQQHPLMAMLMHGSGPQPAYQQMTAMQAMQHHPTLYSPIDQQVAAFQAQMAAAAAAEATANQQQSGLQSQSTNEVSQSSGSGSGASAETSTRAPNKAIALLEKTAANNPLVQIIKPLFKRNKEQKDSANQQKKP